MKENIFFIVSQSDDCEIDAVQERCVEGKGIAYNSDRIGHFCVSDHHHGVWLLVETRQTISSCVHRNHPTKLGILV